MSVQLGDERLGPIGRCRVGEGDARTVGDEAANDAGADTARAAGDECPPAMQGLGHDNSLLDLIGPEQKKKGARLAHPQRKLRSAICAMPRKTASDAP